MIYRYIYKITCTAGRFKDKFYFGQHTTDNLNDGYKGSGCKLKNYYKKHPNDYVKEIISYHNSQEELNQAEYDIIKPWLNTPMCLNLCDGGDMGTCSEETKRKIIIALTGKHIPDIVKYKMSISHKGKKNSEEHNKHISESKKGIAVRPKGTKLTDEHKQHISEGRRSIEFSEEHKKKLSLSHIGISPGNKGKHKVVIDGKITYQ